jgi:GntR family transcriptional regulator/MocR family aminotransferase
VGGTDFLQLDPATAPVRGLTTWLTDELRAAIIDRRLKAGVALPASRVLAEELGVSRGVIVEAYQRLKDEGMVCGQRGGGTIVTGGLAADADDGATSHLPAPPLALAADEEGLPVLPRRWRAGVELDLSPGVPDLSGFPRAAWLRAERTVLDRANVADLGYGDPRGSEWLRHELAGWLARTRGLRAGPEEIIIVTGVAQALALVAHWLRARGRIDIAVENPGSRGARDHLAYWGLRSVPVDVDDDGMRADELVRLDGVRAALLTPAHQFPTGVVLGPQRRRDLVAWAASADGLIVEDDYDAEYRYDRTPVPALQASAPDHVVYAGSTSKTLAPGMRLAWVIPPASMRVDLITAKHASDLGSPAVPQLVLAQLIAEGELERHIRVVRKRQRARRDALLDAAHEHLPQARVQGVAAGLHVLLTFPDLAGRVADTDLADRIGLTGVRVHPLSYHCAGDIAPGLVMGYAAHTTDQLREAVRRIAQVLNGAGPGPAS